ncbi:hypothetical protein CVT24_011563 [Panaeolus cyanescens]|uniref:Uncharacterized protein n=1 Tax=Panaeolus cyanescens TaxID=181874 RepID=A0A409YV83_9AGAR|nr:hypothetical protein CVT24_011563 [Panaeolus cyanescens]
MSAPSQVPRNLMTGILSSTRSTNSSSNWSEAWRHTTPVLDELFMLRAFLVLASGDIPTTTHQIHLPTMRLHEKNGVTPLSRTYVFNEMERASDETDEGESERKECGCEGGEDGEEDGRSEGDEEDEDEDENEAGEEADEERIDEGVDDEEEEEGPDEEKQAALVQLATTSTAA